MQNDRYAAVLAAQNAGNACPHCGSHSGHFNVCPLINRNVAEAQSATLSESDAAFLKGIKVSF